MGTQYRGVLRTYTKADATVEQLDAIREFFHEFLGYPVLTLVDEGTLSFDLDIDHELKGFSPLSELLNGVTDCDGCDGALWIDCGSMIGNYKFVTGNGTPVEAFNSRITQFLDEVQNNLNRVRNHALDHHD